MKIAIPNLGVRMFIIDEVQHLLAGTVNQTIAFLNTLKYFSNEWQIPMIAVGTPQAYEAIVLDAQLANRFHRIELPRWECNEEVRRLLGTFERLIPLRRPSDLAAPELALRLHLMTEGIIGELAYLLNMAAVEALDEEERITDHILDRLAWTSPRERMGKKVA